MLLQICEELAGGGKRVWNTEHQVPYLHSGDLWVGYDDEESIREKVTTSLCSHIFLVLRDHGVYMYVVYI